MMGENWRVVADKAPKSKHCNELKYRVLGSTPKLTTSLRRGKIGKWELV